MGFLIFSSNFRIIMLNYIFITVLTYIIMNLRLRHRCYNFESQGILAACPDRRGKEEAWNVVVQTSEDLSRYYRYQFSKAWHIELLQPSWQAHISVTRGVAFSHEEQEFWNHHDGSKVNFLYGHEVFWNHLHVWINTHIISIDGKSLPDFISPDSLIKHITIGKLAPWHQVPIFDNYSNKLVK